MSDMIFKNWNKEAEKPTVLGLQRLRKAINEMYDHVADHDGSEETQNLFIWLDDLLEMEKTKLSHAPPDNEDFFP